MKPALGKLCLIVSFFFQGALYAGELTVTVFEKGTRNPLPDVTVVWEKSGAYATTDENGQVAFEGVDLPGNIKALGVGFETQSRSVNGDAKVYLEPLIVEGEGLEVIVDRIPEKTSKVVLAREELRKAPGSHGDPLRVVQSLPGVVSRGAQMYVRGSSTADNGVWVNRLPVNYLFHWGDVFGSVSTINPNLVQDFNVFLGGFPVEYGDQLGGYFDVRLRPPKKDRLHQSYRIAMNEASLLLEGPVDANDSFYVAGRHSYLDVVLTPERINELTGADEDDSKISVVTVPQYYDAQALWRHELDRGALDYQIFAAGDALGIVQRNTAKTDPELAGELSVDVAYQTAGVTWQQQWLPGWDSVATLSVDHFRENQTVGSDATGQPFFIKGNYLQFASHPELRWRRQAGEQYFFGSEVVYVRYPVNIYIGREPSEGDLDYNLTTATKYRVNKTIRAGAYAPYVKQRRRWNEHWTTTLGLRYSAIRGTGGIDMNGLMPRAAVEYQLTPSTQVVGSWGRYLQMPTSSHLLQDFGNPALSFTEAEHRVIGLRHNLNTLWNVQLEAYHKPMKNLSLYVAGETPPDNYANVGSGEAYGIDLLIKREYGGRKMGWLSYSYSRSNRTDANGESRIFSGDQPHTLTLVWSQPLPGSWRRWDVGLKLQIHSGKPYTPIIGREKWCYDTNSVCADQSVAETDPNVFWRPIFADFNSDRLPTFYMLHLRVDRPIRFNTWKMNFYVDMQNVTFAENVLGYDYGENYERYADPKKATTLPFVIPFLGVEASF